MIDVDNVKRELLAGLAKELKCEPEEVGDTLVVAAEVFAPVIAAAFPVLGQIAFSLETIATAFDGDPDADHGFRHPPLKQIADSLCQIAEDGHLGS